MKNKYSDNQTILGKTIGQMYDEGLAEMSANTQPVFVYSTNLGKLLTDKPETWAIVFDKLQKQAPNYDIYKDRLLFSANEYSSSKDQLFDKDGKINLARLYDISKFKSSNGVNYLNLINAARGKRGTYKKDLKVVKMQETLNALVMNGCLGGNLGTVTVDGKLGPETDKLKRSIANRISEYQKQVIFNPDPSRKEQYTRDLNKAKEILGDVLYNELVEISKIASKSQYTFQMLKLAFNLNNKYK